MATDFRRLRKSEFARLAGCSLTTVANWIRQGMPVHRDGSVDGWAAAEWKFRRDKAEAEGPDPKDAAGRKLLAEAKLKELELAEEQGRLVRIDEVERTWEGAVSRCRSRLLTLPGKAAPQVVGCSGVPEVKDLLDQFVYEALEELSEDAVDDGGGEGDPEGAAECSVPVPASSKADAQPVGG